MKGFSEQNSKSITWGHNQRIMYKCKSVEEALFYVNKIIENGWSRKVLSNIRKFYLLYSNWNAVRTNLTWTHYRTVLKIEDNAERDRLEGI